MCVQRGRMLLRPPPPPGVAGACRMWEIAHLATATLAISRRRVSPTAMGRMPPLAFFKGNSEGDARLFSKEGSRRQSHNPTSRIWPIPQKLQGPVGLQHKLWRPDLSPAPGCVVLSTQRVPGQMPWGSPGGRQAPVLERRQPWIVFTDPQETRNLQNKVCL